jgi:RND family efflux transporter MFP subunit
MTVQRSNWIHNSLLPRRSWKVVSPISGTVTQKLISEGGTVTAGQTLFVISGSDSASVQFYVDGITLKYITAGMHVELKNSENKVFQGSITAINTSADDTTKRFLVEAEPDEAGLISGTLVDVNLQFDIKPEDSSSILIPLSSISVGQNGNTIFIEQNGIAKEISAEVTHIQGEVAEVKADIPEGALIVTEGNQLLHDGDYLINKTS